jgi:hypothetical protein
MMDEPHDERPDSIAHVHPKCIEVGEFQLNGDHLTASLRVVVCGRIEDLTLVVQPFGEEIGVEVHEAVLDCAALGVVAECVAAKLNTLAGRAALKQASEGTARNRRRGPHVRVRLNRPG